MELNLAISKKPDTSRKQSVHVELTGSPSFGRASGGHIALKEHFQGVLTFILVIISGHITIRKEVKFSELGNHHQSIPRQKLPLKKVANPYLHSASVIRRPQP